MSPEGLLRNSTCAVSMEVDQQHPKSQESSGGWELQLMQIKRDSWSLPSPTGERPPARIEPLVRDKA